ncbi:MAG: extracellular solute-binding protein, partial [Gorillibacterium sp.]|nr:extracellular solute-binding protein [Gorillibacterium sp.]
MRKTRKIVTSLLALTLAFSMTACGSKDKGATNESPKASAVATTAASTAPTVNPDAPGWQSDTSPITFDWYLNFSWFPNKWGVDETSKYITKKTGVDINFIVPAGNENEKLNTLIASGKLPDFITLGWWEDAVKKMIEGKLVLPLNELADQYDPYFFKVGDPSKIGWYT